MDHLQGKGDPAWDAGDPRRPSVSIPGFKIVREIGRGASSVVYEARWLKNQSAPVAIKLLWNTTAEHCARFRREIEVQTHLDVPGVVRCLHAGKHEHMPYYAMELVRGVTFDQYLNSSALTADEKLDVFQKVCIAIAGAHEQGFSHRDVKPGNILVDESGNPHIVDFGLCGAQSDDWQSQTWNTQTRPGDILGTVRYMSPEQAWGGLAGEPIDHRADIWALGIMLYEIITDGGYPYDTRSSSDKAPAEAVLHRIRTETPAPARVCESYGATIKRLTDRCLAWEPDRRIQSARDIANDIERTRQSSPIRTKPLSLTYRLQRVAVGLAIHKRALLWGVAASLILVMLSAFTFFWNVRWRVEVGDPGHPLGSSRDSLVIAGLSNDSVREIFQKREALGDPGVTTDIRTWRGLHGRFMERLAIARPKAVVWDFYFKKEQEEDPDFVRGVLALHQAGVPVVMAVKEFRPDQTPDLSRGIVEPLRDIAHFGSILARDMVNRPGEFVVAMKRDDAIVPSVALLARSATVHSDRRLVVEWRGRRKSMQLAYQEPGRDSVLRVRDDLALTTTSRLLNDQLGARKGDLIACKTLSLASPEEWRARTVDLHDLVTASDEELASRVAGRIVLVGDLRQGLFRRYDRHRVKYETGIINDVPGCYLIADAIYGLLKNEHYASGFPLSAGAMVAAVASSMAGCVLAVLLCRLGMSRTRRGPRVLLCAWLAGTAMSLVVMTVSRDRTAVAAAQAACALSMSLAVSTWIEAARNRRRLSRYGSEGDPQNQAVESTVTTNTIATVTP